MTVSREIPTHSSVLARRVSGTMDPAGLPSMGSHKVRHDWSNWEFMDLTFQVPTQYCSLQHQTSLSPPVTSRAGHCFHFDSSSSFFLELFLYSSLLEYWAPTNMGSSSFSVLSFCLFILLMRFSRQECWNCLPFPPPVDHILSELSIMTCPFWVALHGIDHGFIELDKAMIHVISLVSFLWLWFSFCLPSDGWG